MIEPITIILAFARFASAIARLSLGPLLPILAAELSFEDAAKPALLSAYSSGYILTQIGGGFIADKYGSQVILVAGAAISAAILLILSFNSSVQIWTQAYFGLGLVVGPLFPACSTAISNGVPPERQPGAAAIVDAAAAAGTTVAAMTPILAESLGWRAVLYLTALALVGVAVGSMSMKEEKPLIKSQSLTKMVQPDPSQSKQRLPIWSLLAVKNLCIYLCHSTDNLTKYSVNAWAATMLSEQYGVSPSTVGIILASQEAVGVVSRLIAGTRGGGFNSQKRGLFSGLVFLVQGVCMWLAFGASSPHFTAIMLTVSAIAAGGHSIGYRVMYFDSTPVGAVSGFGNTVASMASAIGPVMIGSLRSEGWHAVGLLILAVNVTGAMGGIASLGATETPRRKVPKNGKNDV